MGVCFVGLVDEFGGTYAPFLGRVAVSGHEFEEGEYEVVGCVW